MALSNKIQSLPEGPGVYLMKDASGKIIYIGKASSLKKRVRSYFRYSAAASQKQAMLVNRIKDLDIVRTGSEAEALILEAGLIKEHRPKYNVAIKDDKAYPLLKVTIQEKFPRLLIVRRRKNDGARYFGPYTNAKLLRQALRFMRRIFPLRSCRIMPSALCLNYHLKLCPGPCTGNITADAYRTIVDNLLLFLQGRKSDLLQKLISQMESASKTQNFEEALLLRNCIESLSSLPMPHKRYRLVDQIEEIRSVLRLKKRPLYIEGYDVSNISGTESVGSLVCFKNGMPYKAAYRRFKIKTVKKIDDYAMLKEVLKRRFTGTLRNELKLPDLILIDGGKGHLQCAADQLQRIQVTVPVISIAKRFEYIYVQWQDRPLILPAASKSLRLFMRIRDEAHRFALTYHRSLRKRQMFFSELDNIPGVGKVRKKVLLQSLDNILRLKSLNVQQLKKIRGIDEKTAKNIVEYWKKY